MVYYFFKLLFLNLGGKIMLDKVNEECGVYGIYTTKQNDNLAPIISVGLTALQHRGEESCRDSRE